MIEIICEIIFEFLITYLLSYPGAAIRWLVSRLWGSKKTLKEFLKEDFMRNGFIGLLAIIGIGLLFFIR